MIGNCAYYRASWLQPSSFESLAYNNQIKCASINWEKRYALLQTTDEPLITETRSLYHKVAVIKKL